MLKYLDSPILVPYYALFVSVWIYMRHYINLRIICALFDEFKTVGPYYLNFATGHFKCELAFWIALGLLGTLQALNIFWLVYIVRIACRFILDSTADDERSEDDEEEGEGDKVEWEK